MPLTVPGYLPAACRFCLEWGGAGGAAVAVCVEAGSGTTATPGVPSCPASHGSPTANACAAKGQSCLPGCITTAQLIPLALPVAHSEFAAAVWLLGFAAAFATRGFAGAMPLMSNQPATP